MVHGRMSTSRPDLRKARAHSVHKSGVGRAPKTMRLPGTWTIGRSAAIDAGGSMTHAISPARASLFGRCDPSHWEPGGIISRWSRRRSVIATQRRSNVSNMDIADADVDMRRAKKSAKAIPPKPQSGSNGSRRARRVAGPFLVRDFDNLRAHGCAHAPLFRLTALQLRVIGAAVRWVASFSEVFSEVWRWLRGKPRKVFPTTGCATKAGRRNRGRDRGRRAP